MRDDAGGEPCTIALGGTLLHRTRLLAPWQLPIEPRPSPEIIVVRQGACTLRDESKEGRALSQGDLMLVLGARARLASSEPRGPLFTEIVRIDYTSTGTTLVPGLTGHPRPLVHLQAAHDHGDREVASVLRLIDAEIDRAAPGRHALLGRLVESLFVYAARAALRSTAGGPSGVDAVTDGLVARAIGLLHARPADRWTVERLAKAIGLSRAAFARRFGAATGVSPLQYVTQVRMQLSEKLLIETDESLASIAARVGYESEFAFSRAFKRHREMAPGAYRRAHRPLLRRAAPTSTLTRAAA